MNVVSAEYLKSLVDIQKLDLPLRPTVAFIGRSNVGKSSLINHLVQRKKLVKTSSTPGKTQLLNYFLINQSIYFVDLPGYGFANVPVSVKKDWQAMIERFLVGCQQLKHIYQLVDLRHKPSREDIEFHNYIATLRTPHTVIANKVDKLKKNEIQKQVKLMRSVLQLPTAPIIHSSLAKIGREEILASIEEACFSAEVLEEEDRDPRL